MDEKNEEDVIMPGFRFHPKDEELVEFYLKRKIHHKSLPIELIKQLEIYKYEPWDLPKLAASGEKEWYFYCPRDRKYRNSARPNRVTLAGFWKATGTDRPIYSSDGTKCVGLKKSLVFYKGRAAKGIKTDWMMHEIRLPSLSDSKPLNKIIPADEAWAICRIFKKNTRSLAQRALSYAWMSSIQEPPTTSDMLNCDIHCTQFSSENVPFSNGDVSNNLMFSQYCMSGTTTKCTGDGETLSVLLNPALISEEQQSSEISINLAQEMQGKNQENSQWGANGSSVFPFRLNNLGWDSDPASCPSEITTTYLPDKCYS